MEFLRNNVKQGIFFKKIIRHPNLRHPNPSLKLDTLSKPNYLKKHVKIVTNKMQS